MGAPEPVLFHFTVPTSEAGRIVWYLDKNGTNAAKLFPNFDGAACALQERLYQQPPERP